MSYVRVTSHYITRVILQFTEVIHWPDANVVKFRLDTVHFLNNFPCDLRVSTCHITFVDLNASAQLSLFISPVIPIVQHSPIILCFIYSRVSSLIRTCKSKDKELTINRELFDVWRLSLKTILRSTEQMFIIHASTLDLCRKILSTNFVAL